MSTESPDAKKNADSRALSSNAAGEVSDGSDLPLSPEDFNEVAEALVSQAGCGALGNEAGGKPDPKALNERLRQLLGENQSFPASQSGERSQVSLARIRALLETDPSLDDIVLDRQDQPAIEPEVKNEPAAAAAVERSAEEEKSELVSVDQSGINKEGSKPQKSRVRRQRYTVKSNDTLELIAAKVLRDQKLAYLIYKINEKKIISFKKEDRLVLDLRARLIIYLPTSIDIEKFKDTQPYYEFVPFQYAFQSEPEETAPLGVTESQPATLPETRTKRRRKNDSTVKSEMPPAEQPDPDETQEPKTEQLGEVTNDSPACPAEQIEDADITDQLEEIARKEEQVGVGQAEQDEERSGPDLLEPDEERDGPDLLEKAEERGGPGLLEQAEERSGPDLLEPDEERDGPDLLEQAEERSGPDLLEPDEERDGPDLLEKAEERGGPDQFEHHEELVQVEQSGNVDKQEEVEREDRPHSPRRQTIPGVHRAEEYKARRNIDRGVVPYIFRDEGSYAIELASNCKLMGNSDASDCYEYSLQLMFNGKWVKAVSYEIYRDRSLRNEFAPDGSRRTIKVDLPPGAVQDLAKKDLEKNWSQYQRSYLNRAKA